MMRATIPATRGLAPRITILGLGNPYGGDDAIGLRVVEAFARQTDLPANITCHLVGAALMKNFDLLAEGDQVILVDAVRGAAAPGELVVYELGSYTSCAAGAAHHVGLAELVAFVGTVEGPRQPVRVLGIGICEAEAYSTQLSAPVARALPAAVAALYQLVGLKPAAAKTAPPAARDQAPCV